MAHPGHAAVREPRREPFSTQRRYELIVVLVAAIVYFSGILSPPSLMDDVDSAQAQMARNMLTSGDWVTTRMDGVAYMEKAPGKYWLTAVSFLIFGVHDWSARIPIAVFTVLLCWLVARLGAWAFSPRVGLYSGLVMATSAGLYLFTRILIPDVILTLSIALSLWSFLRALDDDEFHTRRWAAALAASLAAGVLLKGLIGVVFPAGIAFVYLLATHQLFSRRTWVRLHPFSGLLIFLAIALPWHVLATVRNPPYFNFTLHAGPGQYHGFFWFYFINEHLLRFLNERYPRDYNTVPRLYFWLFHLLWFFPWSVYLPEVARLGFRPVDRAGRTRLLALCWIGFVLVFFGFSTTQEYYSMPIYPALALLIGGAMAAGTNRVRIGTKTAAAVAAVAALACGFILFQVRGVSVSGDISRALTQNPDAYTLSLGHMEDLTLSAFAYLRTPLALACVAFLIGAAGAFLFRGARALAALAVMMVLFFQAARLALIVFDPYMSSRLLAEALNRQPPGTLIIDNGYYTFSSIFFYSNRTALLLNGRITNLEYGSYAPGAPDVFIGDTDLSRLWSSGERYYLAAEDRALPRIEKLLGRSNLRLVAESGGKSLLANDAHRH